MPAGKCFGGLCNSAWVTLSVAHYGGVTNPRLELWRGFHFFQRADPQKPGLLETSASRRADRAVERMRARMSGYFGSSQIAGVALFRSAAGRVLRFSRRSLGSFARILPLFSLVFHAETPHRSISYGLGSEQGRPTLFIISLLRLAPASELSNLILFPVYSEFPKQARGFFDLFRSLMMGFSRQLLVDSRMEATTSPGWTGTILKPIRRQSRFDRCTPQYRYWECLGSVHRHAVA